MGLADCFGAEDRVQVKFSMFYELVKGCTQREQLINGIRCEVPYKYMREMMSGKKEEISEETEQEETEQEETQCTETVKDIQTPRKEEQSGKQTGRQKR